jgi:integrase
MINGKSAEIGLGPAAGPDAITLANARIEATKLRLQVKSGIDPLAERRRDAANVLADAQASVVAGITLKAVAEAHIAANEDAWRNSKHRQQWTNTLSTYVYPLIGDLPVAQVDTAHVLSVLEPIWKAKPETASRVRGRLETILDAAKVRGYRQGENPARWRGHLDNVLPRVSKVKDARNLSLGRSGHHAAMPYADVPAFLIQLRQREAVAALALEFAILTAARSGEVLGATWAEVDLPSKIWIVPAVRMKAHREHRVPLAPRAIEILETVSDLGGEYLFTGSTGDRLSNMALAMLLRRMGIKVTAHGFRSSFRDWAAECTAFPFEVAEMALAHTISNKVEAAYRRGDLFEKRRRLMVDWAAFCETGAATGNNVSPIRKTETG